MNVVKRSEYCNGVSGEVKDDFITLGSIPKGTVFDAKIGGPGNPVHTWIKATIDAICIGKPEILVVSLGSTQSAINGKVYDYKVLNATLVIEGE